MALNSTNTITICETCIHEIAEHSVLFLKVQHTLQSSLVSQLTTLKRFDLLIKWCCALGAWCSKMGRVSEKVYILS